MKREINPFPDYGCAGLTGPNIGRWFVERKQ